LLDKVVRYRFGDNAELMGAWESARNASLGSAEGGVMAALISEEE